MKALINTFVAFIALGTSFSVMASDPAHSPAPTPHKAPIDEKKPLVDLTKKQDPRLVESKHDAHGKELKRIPVPAPMPKHIQAQTGAGMPTPQSYARPEMGLSPYYGNPYDLRLSTSAPAGHKSAKKHVAKKVHKPKSSGHGGSSIQLASVNRLDGQVRYLNQRQNDLEGEVQAVKKKQAEKESKARTEEEAYIIKNDEGIDE